MSDYYLGKTHRYFSLSDYEIDPNSRYRKRIFHEGPHLQTVRSRHPDEIADISTTRPALAVQPGEYTAVEARRKRRRECSVDGRTTDDSDTEMPPMSPFSPTASIFEGVEDIGDVSDSPSVSDRERTTPSREAYSDMNRNEPEFSPKLPISVRPLPKITTVSAKLPSAPSGSNSITQYSNSRLAERARLASLPADTHSPPTAQANTFQRAPAGNSSGGYPRNSGQDTDQEGQYINRYLTVRNDESGPDFLHVVRSRRATISGSAVGSGSRLEARHEGQEAMDESIIARSRVIDESGRSITPETGKIKLERSTPPLDLNAPEQPYSAARSAEVAEASSSVGPEADFIRRRKRSKSTASLIKEGEQFMSLEPEAVQIRKRSERGPTNQVFRKALESGEYVQVSENGWVCRVHGDHLGGPRSVTRHHESVHLNIVVECEYCNAQFSRRDAVLRHQRQSSCKTNPKLKT